MSMRFRVSRLYSHPPPPKQGRSACPMKGAAPTIFFLQALLRHRLQVIFF